MKPALDEYVLREKHIAETVAFLKKNMTDTTSGAGTTSRALDFILSCGVSRVARSLLFFINITSVIVCTNVGNRKHD